MKGVLGLPSASVKVALILTAMALLFVSFASPVSATVTYSSPPYSEATYGTQWTVTPITPTQTITIQGGSAGRMWQVYEITDVGTTPLNKAIVTVQITWVEIGGVWYNTASNLGLVQVLNSNGIFEPSGAYVQCLGTIQPGSSSNHVLNIEYGSSVQEFVFSFNVWYVPS
ncbi:MAG: hypothetical protein ACP5UZ_08050 [Thermoplasmata archaeon]